MTSRQEAGQTEYKKVDADLTGITSDQGGNEFSNPHGADVVAIVNVDKANGTTPTLDISLQERDPQGGEWVDTGDNFSQITSTGVNRLEASAPLGGMLRLHYDVGGTNPDFDVHSSVYLVPNEG